MKTARTDEARHVAGIALMIAAWLAATSWMRPLMLPDEGRYVGVAWEMMRSGDWLTPTLNGLPFFHKPPLFYWITAGSMSLFGVHEWSARLASVLGASLGALSVYLFLRRWASERWAWFALVALLAQPLFYIGGQFANLDMLVAGCIAATTVWAAHAALCAEQGLPHRGALAGAHAMAAAGILAKGLIGAVIPAMVVVAWLLVLGRWRMLRMLIWWPAIALFLVIVAPWFVAMQMKFPEFLDYFFVVQHFKRFASGGFNNVQPFWFYPAMLLLLSLPWLPWLHRFIKATPVEARMPDPVQWLMIVWITVVMLFFSIPQSKLPGYILPAVPPLAVLMARGLLAAGPPSDRARRWWQATAAFTVAVSMLALAWLACHPTKSTREIARVLGRERQPGEAVVMLGQYRYDLPFYARTPSPAIVVDEWQDPDLPLHDNWRKELADAGRFAPSLAASVLVLPQALQTTLCRAGTTWVIGTSSAASSHPFLRMARLAASVRDVSLWKVDTHDAALFTALHCAGTPNGGSASK